MKIPPGSAHVVPTYVVTIHMAGDVNTAMAWLRREVWERGLCVTVSPESFIYTGGQEEGFRVGLVNYPRFPSKPEEIFRLAHKLAFGLIIACSQRSALVVGQDRTEWIIIEAPGERKSGLKRGRAR